MTCIGPAFDCCSVPARRRASGGAAGPGAPEGTILLRKATRHCRRPGAGPVAATPVPHRSLHHPRRSAAHDERRCFTAAHSAEPAPGRSRRELCPARFRTVQGNCSSLRNRFEGALWRRRLVPVPQALWTEEASLAVDIDTELEVRIFKVGPRPQRASNRCRPSIMQQRPFYRSGMPLPPPPFPPHTHTATQCACASYEPVSFLVARTS